eukprot:2133605-Prymnesium_polylepis.1
MGADELARRVDPRPAPLFARRELSRELSRRLQRHRHRLALRLKPKRVALAGRPGRAYTAFAVRAVVCRSWCVSCA